MPQLPQPFNAQTIQPATADGSSAQLPVGEWPVVIRSTDIRPVKDNNNAAYLLLNLEIIDGPHKGATGAYRLNIHSESAEARNIAYRQLSSVCYVTGQIQITDADQLKDKPFIVIVKPQTDPKYTQVVGVLDSQGRDPGKSVQTPASAAPPTAAPFAQPAPTVMLPQANPAVGWAPASAPASAPAAVGWNPGGAAPAAGGAAPWGSR